MATCRICNNEQFTVLLAGFKTDSGDVYSLKECMSCSFVTIEPLPSSDKLKACYDKDYWQEDLSKPKSATNLFYRFRMRSVVQKIKGHVPSGGKILDWGAGDGKLMTLLGEAGYDCRGIDVYKEESDDKRLANATIESTDFDNESFDAITCFHVLEHLRDPVNSVKRAFELLRKGGVLIIEVPNIDSLGFQIFKKRWQPLEIPTHLNHFSLKSLRMMFSSLEGVRIIDESFFSHRVSPSSIVLSLFPGLTPKKIRRHHGGKCPIHLLGLYLMLQLITYPLAIIESAIKKGAVVRIFAKKTK